MARSKPILLALAVTAMAVALVACGDDDSNEIEDQIREAIELAATSGEPSVCTEQQTQAFNEQTTGETGPAATESCEENAADTPADEVEVSNVEVNGDSATAEAAFRGSLFDQQTIELALIEDGEDWKLDQIVGFTEFNRAAFDAGFQEELSADEEVPPQAAKCITQQFAGLSDEEVQQFFLEPSDQRAEQLFGPCFGG